MTFITDSFQRKRGGYSRILKITCRECGSFVCNYQKDGGGNLRRMYKDRMTSIAIPISKKSVQCPRGHVIGMSIIYEKEQRPAIRLFVESVVKKIIKS